MSDEATVPEVPTAKVAEARRSMRVPAPKLAIELRGVTKEYGATIAVNDLNLRVPEGSTYGLIGPNGAGKTTTFSMIAGYVVPTRGEALVLDHGAWNVGALKGKLGVLPQDALLPANERVGDFLVYLARLQGIAATAAERHAKGVLAEVDGASWWGTKCGALSHGMAKRVGIAQALLGDPAVVLLDEPTAGLDPKVAYHVRQLIKSRKGRATLVVSSHNLQELEEVCDHAAILDRGRLVVSGSMAELTSSAEEVRFEIAPGPMPEPAIRMIEGVVSTSFDPASRELVVRFERNAGDAEEMIRRVLVVLLQENARISGIAKGRRLEQRVMELTEGAASGLRSGRCGDGPLSRCRRSP